MNIRSMPGNLKSSWAVELRSISKRYGSASKAKWALKNVDLTIHPGIFGLLGRNGAGKTTLLNILATLLEPTSGQISVGQLDLKRERLEARSLIGFLPQEQGFYMNLTVKNTLDYMAALQNLPNRKYEVARVLEAVNLSDRTKTKVGSLSGGMRRRLGLALALLGNPKLLIVDEPTTGLDVVEQQRFRTLLGTLGAQQEQIILLSTHIVSDIETIASSVAVLEQGQLIFQGTTKELAHCARGQSWLWRTTIEIVEAARRDSNFTITSITPVADGSGRANEVVARVEGRCPAPNAIACEPTLEDGYFSLIGGTENAGSAHADLVAKLRATRGY